MAKQMQVILVDDLDKIEGTDIDTIHFALDGVSYEIDLNEKNAKSLREVLSKYTAAARKDARVGRPARSATPKSTPGKSEAKAAKGVNGAVSDKPKSNITEVKKWASENGFAESIPARGRMPRDIPEAYDKATSS